MAKENIAFYVVPSTDAHGSEYLAPCDKRRQWLTGFTGSAGTAVISMGEAYLFVDSRYYIQAARQLDENWTLMKVGWDGMKNWDDWLIDHARGVKIGIDSRMISLEATNKLVAALTPRASSLMFPWQNLVDLIWKERPVRPKDPIYVQPIQFTGEDAKRKLGRIREWITKSAPMTERFSTNPPKEKDIPIAAFLADLADIAYTLNLRGSDIPYTPVFMSYLFITMENAILFIENGKISEEVREYLTELGVQTKEYSEVWPFLRSKDWGAGKVLISPDVPYTVARSLTSLRYSVAPPFVAVRRMVKNEVELAGMERAYLRDGAAMVQWFAWLDEKVSQGYEIDEYQAAMRLKEFRAQGELYQGLAYEAIAASGPNAALPHYVPPRHGSNPIDRKTPFLIDAGGQYRDGTCDTTRTLHFGKPTDPQAEAFTRVLQGHISIDSAIFPEGTSGAKLDVLARRALWQDGYHGTGHGVGSFLSVLHIGFGKDVPLEPGNVISNEPGFYLEGDFGVRIESVLAVQRIRTKNEFQGPIWLGFRRLTQVPIQLKMIKASMLSKEERQWVRNHNEECRRKLEPLLREDKRALRWLRKECQPAFRSEASVSGVSIEWD
ncbi:hypothetical protein M422DRAFT_60541 [Sphaerobolus stellatus SS14]|uniref:Xaa-Pro aminopeptidase n=1 Tax=Sphaerobolus stellatus (strain SS14) TaxID=990650 RepID=A0A0C9VSE9_SPHS4|nr:hypothetical protein M422DRAFT_60541 [Sphaerobolus stellatus SS14]